MRSIKTNNRKTLKCETIYNNKGVFVERVEYKHVDVDGKPIGHRKVYYGIYADEGLTFIDCVTDKEKAMKIIAELERN